MPSSYGMPLCAISLLRSCKFDTIVGTTTAPALPDVNAGYLIHHSPNAQRGDFQKAQLPLLGLNIKVAVDYETTEIVRRLDRSCVIKNGTTPSQKTISQNLKLLASLVDMLDSGYPRAFFFEDDVVVHFDGLRRLWDALRKDPLKGGFSIVHLSSYNICGRDSLANGVHPKQRPFVRHRPTLLMPGVANLLSAKGAAHVLGNALPLSGAGLDGILSDVRQQSAPRTGAYYVKPYPFTAGAFGSANLFDCAFDAKCERAFYDRWGCDATHFRTSRETLERQRMNGTFFHIS